MYQPLADLLRPTTLDEVFGQDHILGEGAVLRRLIQSGNVPNMIFYGPSGTGKTTVANIIAQQTRRKLFKLNATTASTADIKEIVSQLDTFLRRTGFCCIWTRSSPLTRSSSNLYWNSSKMERSP